MTAGLALRIVRLRIENLRRFGTPVEFDGLHAGLNLFVGPNGAGKSTLVAALRAAFLERHGSTTLAHLQPWGRADAVPSVEIDFDWQGRRHRLAKRFRPRPAALLTVDGTSRDGNEAEDQLAALLGFAFASRGSSRLDMQGVPGLLWVEQGRNEIDDKEGLAARVGHASAQLTAAITQVVGEVSSSRGDALLERARAERERYLTGARAQARNALLVARTAVGEDDAIIENLRRELDAWRAHVDELANLRAVIENDREAATAVRLQADLDQAKARLSEAEQLLERQRQRKAELVARQNERALVETRLQAMTSRRSECERRERELASATELQLAARERLAQAVRSEATARAAREQAATRRTHAEAREAIDQLTVEHRRRIAEKTELAERLARLDTLRTTLVETEREVARTAIDPKAVERLHDAVRAVQLAQARAEAVAPLLRHQLLPGASIRVDGAPLTGYGERRLTGPSSVDIAGVGRLTIEPGAGDQAQHRADLSAAEAKRDERMAALDISQPLEADQRLAAHRDAAERLRAVRQRLADLAPNGIDALVSRAAALDGEVAAIAGRLTAAQRLIAEPLDARVSLAEATAALHEAHDRLQRAEAHLRQAREAEVAASGQLAAARTELERIRSATETDTPERSAALQTEMAALGVQIDSATLEVSALAQAIGQARTDILHQDIARLNAALQADQQQRRSRHERRIRLETTLESEGNQGLDERLAEALAKRERDARRLDQLEKEARAWTRIVDLLEAGRQRTTQRLQAPLRARIDHYLGLLMPGARLQLDDNLAPTGLTIGDGPSAGTLGGLAEQSYGTREQIGLIARLAYADLLADAGRPTLIIIDDGLVHSDAERLAQMKRILFDAGQRHQILLFSCHPDLWRDLGVPAVEVGGG